MVATYRVPYSNRNNQNEISWAWTVSTRIDNIFSFCLKNVISFHFILKTVRCLWLMLYNYRHSDYYYYYYYK